MKRLVLFTSFFFLLIGYICPSLQAAEKPALVAHYFYTPGCPLCEPANRAVENAEKHFAGKVIFVRHNLTTGQKAEDEKQFNILIMALTHCKREDTPKLTMFAGDECISDDQIKDNLIPRLQHLLDTGQTTPDFAKFGGKSNEEIIKMSEDRYALPLVGLTALFDGFNPCAFATVILFVSMLGTVGRERKTILYVGISFITAVFIAYFMIGLFFYYLMKLLEFVEVVSLAIKWLALAMVLVAGVLSLVDAWKAWRSAGKAKMLLVLPEGLKNRIRKRLRATAHGGSLIAGAFVSGFIISFLEAACTGQVYFPLITKLVEFQPARAYGLLTFYNVIFILPLLAVFVMAFYGMTSEQIGNMTRKKVWLTKGALGVVFLAMAVWLGTALLPTLGLGENAASAPATEPATITAPEHPAGDPDESSATPAEPAATSHEVADDVDR